MPRRKGVIEGITAEEKAETVIQGRSLRTRKCVNENEKSATLRKIPDDDETAENSPEPVDIEGVDPPKKSSAKGFKSLKQKSLDETFVVGKSVSQTKAKSKRLEKNNEKKMKGKVPANDDASNQEDEGVDNKLNATFVLSSSANFIKTSSGKGKTNKRNAEVREGDVQPEIKKAKDKTEKLNATDTDYSKLSFNSKKTNANGEQWNLKISSWNVDGLRAWFKKDGAKFVENENPDILCLQETKCSEDKIPEEAKFKGYNAYWASAGTEGYSGVALFSKEKPINVKYGIGIKEHDTEGSLITAEYETFYLVTTYVPNAGKGLVTLPKRLSWNAAFEKYLKELDSKKPVILCGDMNVAHQEIDLANPKTNTKNAGFTKEEREGMTQLLSQGFIDTFRHFYPKETGAYTFWTYMRKARDRNVGWRIDYFIVSERIISQVCDNIIRKEVLGSDHCPITLLIHIK